MSRSPHSIALQELAELVIRPRTLRLLLIHLVILNHHVKVRLVNCQSAEWRLLRKEGTLSSRPQKNSF